MKLICQFKQFNETNEINEILNQYGESIDLSEFKKEEQSKSVNQDYLFIKCKYPKFYKPKFYKLNRYDKDLILQIEKITQPSLCITEIDDRFCNKKYYEIKKINNKINQEYIEIFQNKIINDLDSELIELKIYFTYILLSCIILCVLNFACIRYCTC